MSFRERKTLGHPPVSQQGYQSCGFERDLPPCRTHWNSDLRLLVASESQRSMADHHWHLCIFPRLECNGTDVSKSEEAQEGEVT